MPFAAAITNLSEIELSSLATLGRTVSSSFFASLLALALFGYIQRNQLARRLTYLMLAVLLLQPPLATGYYYGHFVPLLLQKPWLNEFVYCLLLIGRLLPWAMVMAMLIPPMIDRRAIYLNALLKQQDESRRGQSIKRQLHSWLASYRRSFSCAFLMACLIGYQEFELASLMSLSPRNWSEYLFILQPIPLGITLKKTILPVAILLLAVAFIGRTLMYQRKLAGQSQPLLDATRGRPRHSWSSWSSWPRWPRCLPYLPWPLVILSVLFFMSCVLPWFRLFGHSLPTLRAFGRVMRVMDNSWHSWLIAMLGASFAVAILGSLRLSPRRIRKWMPLCLLLPTTFGLAGPLVLSLIIHKSVLSAPLLRPIYNTALPWFFGFAILVSPYLLLAWLLFLSETGSHVHSARLLFASKLRLNRIKAWRLYYQLRLSPMIKLCLMVILLLMFELLMSDLLHPIGMTPISSLLYNQMHFEATHMLSAQILLAMLFALVLTAAFYGILRLLLLLIGQLITLKKP